MIVKMSKYAFMVYHREYDRFLTELRELGVVHVKENRSILDNAELQELLARRRRVAQLMRYFKSLNVEEKDYAPARELTKDAGMALLRQIEELQDKKAQLQTAQASLEKDIAYMDFWGDFSRKDIDRLKEAGYEITFWTCPTAKYEPKWGDEYNAVLINNVQSVTYFLTITKTGTAVEIDAERQKMPDGGLQELNHRLARLKEEMAALDTEMKALAAAQYNTLDRFDKDLQNEFNLSNVLVQTDREAGDKLMLLEGWVPTEMAQTLEKTLEEKGYFYQALEIGEGDRVPILLRNGRFAKLFEPITRMFSLPNYGEFDPTPFFAPFFMLFFGLCFGDGGYGLLVMLVCTLLKRKVSADYKPFVGLFWYLGLAALIVGTCTGTFFGIAFVDIKAFEEVKDYFVSSDNLMTFSIIIGLVQILFGKTVAALKIMSQKGTKYGIASLAWVFIILAMCVVFGLPALDVRLPETVETVALVVAGLGLIVAFLYNTPGKNIFLNFGTGLWNTYNVVSGLLGDTLSYIRLFAIGLTGGILGGVFNSLAVDMTAGMNVGVRVVCMLLILLAGHAINIGLCTISSLVHPLRLIFVEYYKNAEFEGGGKDYQPFKKA